MQASVEGSFAMPMGTEPVRRRMASRLKRAVLQGTSILFAIWLAAFFTPQFHHPLKLANSSVAAEYAALDKIVKGWTP